jgi:hypothetical protein
MTCNMLCSPTLTNEQIKFCDAYLTAIPENIETMNKEDFKNLICETFTISPEQLAMSLSNFRLFYNEITCRDLCTNQRPTLDTNLKLN